MARVVADAELLLDGLGDAAAGPDLAAEAVRFGPVPQEVRQQAQLGVARPGGAARGIRERSASGPPWAAAASQALTADSEAPRAVAMSRCFQPCWLRSSACMRRHSLQS